jgi:hypothetical protein
MGGEEGPKSPFLALPMLTILRDNRPTLLYPHNEPRVATISALFFFFVREVMVCYKRSS